MLKNLYAVICRNRNKTNPCKGFCISKTVHAEEKKEREKKEREREREEKKNKRETKRKRDGETDREGTK